MQTRNCLKCNKEIIGPHNKKYCGSQEIRDSCAHIAGKESMKRIWREKRDLLKWKPCQMCGKMIEAKGSTKYCGNQRTVGTCSYEKVLENGRNQKFKPIKEVPNRKLTMKDDEPVINAITPRQERILETLKHNRNAARLVVRKN